MSIIKVFLLLLLSFMLFVKLDAIGYMNLCLFLALAFVLLSIKYISLRKLQKNERESFIKTLNHDLRVACIAQIRALDILQKNSYDEQKEFVKEINDSCKYSLDMITNLLNSYKFKKGECVLEYENFNLTQLINNVCKKNKELLEQKNILLRRFYKAEVSLYADKTMLEKAISILLDTAIINSLEKQDISIYTKQHNESISFSIFYNGLPLTEEEYSRIFSEKHAYTTVGHGIKMQLCKNIIDFHKGSLKICNCGGNTNLLTFTVPKQKKQIFSKDLCCLTFGELCQEK